MTGYSRVLFSCHLITYFLTLDFASFVAALILAEIYLLGNVG